MNILVFNAGSSSQKSCLYSLDTIGEAAQPPDPIWEAQIDWLPQEKAATISVHTAADVKVQETVDAPSRSETLLYLLNFLHAGPTRVVANLGDIDVVGHRVVHGGKDYQESVRVTPDVKAAIAGVLEG